MARVTIHIGGRDRLAPAISKATPMGLLGTEAIVHLGPVSLTGSATAMRALADACEESAAMAEAYDADPDAFNQRQQAELLDPEEPSRWPPATSSTTTPPRPASSASTGPAPPSAH